MKRRSFLKGCMLATAMVAAPMKFVQPIPKVIEPSVRGYIDPFGGLVIEPATGSHLNAWSDLYAFTRMPGESDKSLRNRIAKRILNPTGGITFET